MNKKIVQNDVTNKQEITCVADYLTVIKNEVQQVDQQSKRFYRGLEKKEYIPTDYPSIYRSPHSDKYEPYIKYEHKMFYDLVSRFPEQFSSCKNTFEHLVMMQHYEFPTRLLDVTSNPLVALYFACVDKHGNVNEKDDKGNDLDGAVTIYDIPNKQVKNYNSDTVTVLSNLSRMDEKFVPNIILYNNFLNFINERIKTGLKYNSCDDVKKIFVIFNIIMNEEKPNFERHYISDRAYNIICELKKIIENYSINSESYLALQTEYDSFVHKEYNNEDRCIDYCYGGPLELDDKLSELIDELNKNFNDFIKLASELKGYYYNDHNIQFEQAILEEKSHFIYNNIKRSDMVKAFCVNPKLNNPRILRQNGAFLLSGFASQKATKLFPPEQHFELKAKSVVDGCAINITIKGNKKPYIVEELKQLGIHRAFLFPEIDKVAQIVKNEYEILKNDS